MSHVVDNGYNNGVNVRVGQHINYIFSASAFRCFFPRFHNNEHHFNRREFVTFVQYVIVLGGVTSVGFIFPIHAFGTGPYINMRLVTNVGVCLRRGWSLCGASAGLYGFYKHIGFTWVGNVRDGRFFFIDQGGNAGSAHVFAKGGSLAAKIETVVRFYVGLCTWCDRVFRSRAAGWT